MYVLAAKFQITFIFYKKKILGPDQVKDESYVLELWLNIINDEVHQVQTHVACFK